MLLASFEIEVNRPVSQVFELLADIRNDLMWRKGILEINYISGSEVGSRYRKVMIGPGNRRISSLVEITGYRKNEFFCFREGIGSISREGRYVLTSLDGHTLLEFRLEVKLSGLKRFLERKVQSAILAEVSALPSLKYVLESA